MMTAQMQSGAQPRWDKRSSLNHHDSMLSENSRQSINELEGLKKKLQEETEKIVKWKVSTQVNLAQKDRQLSEASQLIEYLQQHFLEMQLYAEQLSQTLEREKEEHGFIVAKVESTRSLCQGVKLECEEVFKTISDLRTLQEHVTGNKHEMLSELILLKEKFSSLSLTHKEQIQFLEEKGVQDATNYTQEVDKLKCELADRDLKVHHLTEDLKSKCTELEEISILLEKEKSLVISANKENQDLNQEIIRVNKIVQEKEQELEGKCQEISQHKAYNEEIENECTKLKKSQEDFEAAVEKLCSLKKVRNDLEGMNEELKQQVFSLNEQKELLQKDVETSRTEIHSLKNSQEKLFGEVDRLTGQLAALHSSYEVTNANREELKMEIQEVEDQLSETVQQLNQERQHLSESKGKIEELKQKMEKKGREMSENLKTKDEAILSLQKTIKDQDSTYKEKEHLLNSEIQGLRQTQDSLRKKVKELQSETKMKENELAEVKKEIIDIKEEIERTMEVLDEVRSQSDMERSRHQDEMNSKILKLKEKEAEVTNLSAKMEQLQVDIKEKGRIKDEIHNEIEMINEEKNQLSKTVVQLRKDYELKSSDYDDVVQNVETLKDALQGKESRVQQLETDIKAGKQKLTIETRKNEKLQKKIEILEGRLQTQRKEIEASQQTITTITEKMEKDLNESRQKNEHLSEELNSVKAKYFSHLTDMQKSLTTAVDIKETAKTKDTKYSQESEGTPEPSKYLPIILGDRETPQLHMVNDNLCISTPPKDESPDLPAQRCILKKSNKKLNSTPAKKQVVFKSPLPRDSESSENMTLEVASDMEDCMYRKGSIGLRHSVRKELPPSFKGDKNNPVQQVQPVYGQPRAYENKNSRRKKARMDTDENASHCVRSGPRFVQNRFKYSANRPSTPYTKEMMEAEPQDKIVFDSVYEFRP